MLKRFFGSYDHDEWFQNCEELKSLSPLLDRLEQKKCELHKDAAEKGEQSIDYDKYKIICKLYREFKNKIKTFNPSTEPNSLIVTQAKKNLVSELQASLKAVQNNEDNSRTLNEPRNDNKKLANQYVHRGIVGGATTIGALSSGLWGAVKAYGQASVASTAVRKVTGLSDLTPDSQQLLNEFDKTLTKIHEQLTRKEKGIWLDSLKEHRKSLF